MAQEEENGSTDIASSLRRRRAGPDHPSETGLHAPQQRQQDPSRAAYAEDGYYVLNPWFGQSDENGPLFSLAWPFPRTIRPGMMLGHNGQIYRAWQRQQSHSSDAARDDGRGDLEKRNVPSQIWVPDDRLGSYIARAPKTSAEERRAQPVGVFNTTRGHNDHQPEADSYNTPSNGLPAPSDRLSTTESNTNNAHSPHEQQQHLDELRNGWARLRAKHPEPLAEFLSTTLVLFLGMSASLSVTIGNGDYGTYQTKCWAWGLAIMVGVYTAGGISGAHMNPAVSLTLCIFRGFSKRSCGIYISAQVLAGLVAGGLVYAVYHDAIHSFDPGMSSLTGSAFYTTPQASISTANAFFSESVATAILMAAILAFGDDQNAPPGSGLNALVLGLLVSLLEMAMGYNTGPCLNPARDLGPRLVALASGYQDTFATGWWAYGAWGATISGSIVGCVVYDMLIFVGGESPINYRMPNKQDMVRGLTEIRRRS